MFHTGHQAQIADTLALESKDIHLAKSRDTSGTRNFHPGATVLSIMFASEMDLQIYWFINFPIKFYMYMYVIY